MNFYEKQHQIYLRQAEEKRQQDAANNAVRLRNEADSARQKIQQDKNLAFSAGVRGDTSGRYGAESSSYYSGASVAGNDPHTGKPYFSYKPPTKREVSPPRYYAKSGSKISSTNTQNRSTSNGGLFLIIVIFTVILFIALQSNASTSKHKSNHSNTTRNISSNRPMKKIVFTHYVNGTNVNVRVDASENYPPMKLIKPDKYDCIMVVRSKNNWSLITFDTDSGFINRYIYSPLLKRLEKNEYCS